MIKVIGLGWNAGDITLRGSAETESGYTVLKTSKIAAAKDIKADETLDTFYDDSQDFDELNKKIADRLTALEQQYSKVNYLVGGDGYTDSSIPELERRTGIEIIGGVTAGSVRAPASGTLIVCASDLAARPYIDTAAALCVLEIDSPEKAGEVKLYLSEYYDAGDEVMIATGGKILRAVFEDIDRQKKYAYDSAVFLPARPGFDKTRFSAGDLRRIIEILTAPDGCPWDKAQTHLSIAPNMLEEAYEAVDALQRDDLEGMEEELGDVLLQTFLHCDIASRCGEFSLGDCITVLAKKLISRHTHIFGGLEARNEAEAHARWDAAKAVEKKQSTLADALDAIPESFPALLKAQKTIKKINKAGKKQADKNNTDESGLTDGHVIKLPETSAGFGYLLLSLCSAAAEKDIDCETALTESANKLKALAKEAESGGKNFSLAGLMEEIQ